MPLSKTELKEAMLNPDNNDIVVRDFFEYLLDYGEDNLKKLRDEIVEQDSFELQKKVVKAKVFHDVSIDFLEILNTDVSKGIDYISAKYTKFFAKYDKRIAHKELADLLASPFDNKISSIEEDKRLLAQSWRSYAIENASKGEPDEVLDKVIESFEEQSNPLAVLNNNLKKELKEYKKQVEDLTNTLSTMETDVEHKRASSADKAMDLREELNKSNKLIEEKDEKIKLLEAELASNNTLKFKIEQRANIAIEEIKVENDNLKRKNDDLETKIDYLENKISQEKNKQEMVEKELGIVEGMREETQSKYAKIINDLKDRMKKLEEETATANAKYSKLLAENQHLNKTNSILDQDLKDSTGDKVGINKKLNEVTEKFKNKINEITDSKKIMEAELNEMKNLVEDKGQIVANLEADMKFLKEDKITDNAKIIKLTGKIKELQDKSSIIENELTAKYRNTEDKLKKTVETLKEALIENKTLMEQKDALNINLKKSMEKIKEFQNKVDDGAATEESKVRDLNFKLVDAKKQNAIMKKEIDFMKEENINLQKNLNLSIEKIKQMQDKESGSNSMINVIENEYKAKLKELAQKYYDIKKELEQYKK